MPSSLLYVDSLSRHVRKVQELEPEHRKLTWRVYRDLRRLVRPGVSLLVLHNCAQALAAASPSPRAYAAVKLGVHLANAFTQISLATLGAEGRVHRHILEEAFKVLQRYLAAALGLRDSPTSDRWSRGHSPGNPWLAVSDGSFRSGRGSAGVVVYDSNANKRAEIGLAVEARSSVDAELQACLLALHTLDMFGAAHVKLLVDAQSVVSAFQQKLPLRHSVTEGLLLQQAESFESLQVERVSRVATYEADRLASASTATDVNACKVIQ